MSIVGDAFHAPLGRFRPQRFGARLFEGWEHLLFIPDSSSLGASVVADEPPLEGEAEPSPGDGS